MTIESKIVFENITSSNRILLHLHPKPDPDSIGSALATYHALKSIGKEVTIIEGDSTVPSIFSFLPGFDEIVHKNFFEIDLADFDLFIIQDSGSKELISRKREVIFPDTLKTIVIDHHRTNERFADINIVDDTRAATAELLYDLFKEWGIKISQDIASCLYVGIWSDTGGFKYPYTTSQTLRIASELAEIYPKFIDLIENLDDNYPAEKIYFDALALGKVEVINKTVALVVVSSEEMKARGITREVSDMNQIASMLLAVKDWEVGVTIIEKSSGEVSVSFRSKKEIDVSNIAKKLGGGGHRNAAGVTLMMSLEEAKAKVIEFLL